MARRIRRSIGPLDLRAQAILRAVIEEYVTTATPVGSQALVDRYRLGVSSATVRNILAELELAGLLGHPHTSAGRIPTDAGYRWYVESIIDSAPLPEVEQLMIRHQFGQVEFASEHWFRLAASTIASMTHAAGPRDAGEARRRARPPGRPRLDQRSHGEPRRRAPRGLDQAVARDPRDGRGPGGPHDRGRDPERPGCRPDHAGDRRRPSRTWTRPCPTRTSSSASASASSALLSDYDRAAVEEVFSDGLLNVMGAPEFAHSEKLRRVFTALENRAYLGELVGSVAASGRVKVFIGMENEPPDMREVALVLAPYGRRDRAVGVVGRPRAHAPRLFRGDPDGPLRVRAHERARRPPVQLIGDHSRMERTTRAQQRADAIDVSPAKLAAEIERLTRERDLARRQTELARDEIARLQGPTIRQTEGAKGQPATDGASKGAPAKGASKGGVNVDDILRERDDFLAALQRERAEFLNFKRRTAEERDAMLGLAAEDLIRKVLALADDFDLAVEHRPGGRRRRGAGSRASRPSTASSASSSRARA